MTPANPDHTAAREIAEYIDRNPLVARQVKEYIKTDRLLEVLEIEAPEPEEPTLEEATHDELIQELSNRLNK